MITPLPGGRKIRMRQRMNDPWLAWAVLFAGEAALVLAGNRRTVTGNYREAAFLWFLGQDLYTGAVGTFRKYMRLYELRRGRKATPAGVP